MKAGMDCISIFGRLCVTVAESKITTRTGVLSVTVSIGVARAAVESMVDEILAAADAALYQAKNEGRNRVAHDGRCISEGDRPCES
jgi:diguanylate cyclase (GGDEF)-like protein